MSTSSQRRHFEKKKNRYDEQLLSTPPRHVVEETEYMMSELSKRKIRRVVDFGSGNGRLTLPLLKKGFNVTAVDISRNSLLSLVEYVKGQGIKKGLLMVSETIPLKKWDAIVGCDILHHVALHETLTKIRSRLTDKKGIIVFSEPNIFNPSWAVFVTLFHSWRIEGGMVNCHYFNFQKELQETRFDAIHLHGYGLLPPIFFNRIPILRKINYFLGDLPVLKFFAYRFIITAQAAGTVH